MRGLSKEVQLRLNQFKPETIGQATRIQGITPAAISLLLVHLKKGLAYGNNQAPDADPKAGSGGPGAESGDKIAA